MNADLRTSGVPNSQQYTILRIKRKRNEEPLDALVVEDRVRRKKSRGGIGIFQFAKTVEQAEWQNAERQKELQAQISRLTKEAKTEVQIQNPVDPPTSLGVDAPVQSGGSSPARHPAKEEAIKRYKVVEQPITTSENWHTRTGPKAPPKVISSKDVAKKSLAPNFKLYEAILSSQNDGRRSPVDDEQMERFMPMLQDYLKIHDIDPVRDVAPVKNHSRTSSVSSGSSGNDYVYDVFYHRPATLSEWNEAANVGRLSGLPPTADDYDSESDDEVSDEADEDSNAEEYYKNDYPDEEDPDDFDSDEYEESEDDNNLYGQDDDDHEWR